jgi:hypothetical protein
VRVINQETRKWSVPYCARCLKHADLAAALPELHHELQAEAHQKLQEGERHARAHLAAVTAKHLVPTLGPLVTAILIVLVLGAWFDGLAALLGFVLFVVPGAFVSWRFTYPAFRRARELARNTADAIRASAAQRAAALKGEFRERLAQLRLAVTPTCGEPTLAVAYDGWQGTVHTFRFRSKAFADAFRQANAAKVV